MKMEDYPQATADFLRRVWHRAIREGWWRFLLAFAVACFSVVVLISIVILVGDRNELRDVTNCRSGLATDVTDAQTDYLLAIGALVEAIANDIDLDPAIAELAAAGDALDTARDARVTFETDPTGEC